MNPEKIKALGKTVVVVAALTVVLVGGIVMGIDMSHTEPVQVPVVVVRDTIVVRDTVACPEVSDTVAGINSPISQHEIENWE